MSPFSFVSLAKFLIGILLLQGATVLVVYAALKTDLSQTWLLFGALGVTLGAITALWFSAMAEHARKQSLAKAQASFSREREKLRVRAEQEKSRERTAAQRKLDREKQRAKAGGNLKTGLVIGGAVTAGLVLMLTQMVTLGLLTLTTAGGAALGYGVRARQERLGLGARSLLGRPEKTLRVVDPKPAAKALEAQPPAGADLQVKR